MENLGFSYIGSLFLLMLFIPNLIWLKYKPKNYSTKNENKLLLAFERIGQIGVACTVTIFSNFNINKISLWSLWLLIAFIIMLFYECWWIRYFRSKQSLSDFYSSFFGVPVAGATLPIIAFFLLSIYGKIPLLTFFVILLGIGHIGIHLQHKKEINKEFESNH